MFWLIVFALIVLLPAYVYTAFFALCTAKRLLKSGIELRPGMRMTCRVLLITGWPADVLFNQLHGRYLFGEWRGVTFTSRIQYYYDHPDKCPDQDEYMYWYLLLETADPGHVDRIE